MELGLIYSYLDELGNAATYQNRCTLATACHLVIDGRVGEDMKHRIVNIIAWQDTQMLRVYELLSLLVDKALISPPLDQRACRELAKKDYEAWLGLASRISDIPGVKEMEIPPSNDDRYINIVFDDACGMLVDAVFCEQVLNPWPSTWVKLRPLLLLSFNNPQPSDRPGSDMNLSLDSLLSIANQDICSL